MSASIACMLATFSMSGAVRGDTKKNILNWTKGVLKPHLNRQQVWINVYKAKLITESISIFFYENMTLTLREIKNLAPSLQKF